MTQNTLIWALNSVETPFCHSLPQICHTTVFAATISRGLSDLLNARGLAHSNRITDLFLMNFSAGWRRDHHFPSPRKLHPVLRMKHAEKDRFTTQQKMIFLRYLMMVFLDNVK